MVCFQTDGAVQALPAPAGQRGSTFPRLRGALLAALTLVLWVSLLSFPTFVGGGDIDESWAQCLGYFLRHGRQAGTDYVFTYGPLGYFLTAAYDPGLFWPKYGWELGLKLLAALAALGVARRLPGFDRQAIFLGLAIAFLPYHPGTVACFLALALGLLPFLERRLRPAYLVPCSAVLVLLALTKATVLVLALGAVAALTLHALLDGRRLAALAPGALFALFFVLAWVLLGQSPAHLPAYLVGTWHITAGYGEAMAMEGLAWGVPLSLGVLLLLSAAVLLQTRSLRRSPQTAVATAFLAGFVFVVWKHGFVLHDVNHTPSFFALIVFVPFLLEALYPHPDYRLAWRALLGGGLVLGLLGQPGWHGLALAMVLLLTPSALRGTPFLRPGDRRRRYAVTAAAVFLALFTQLVVDDGRCLGRRCDWFRANAAAALAPQAMRRKLEALKECRLEYWSLPRTRAAVGGAPIDLFAHSQGVLLVNGLNYRPRPVFQSYSAYTPYLAEANARFYRGADAPDYVLLRLESFGYRPPMSEDGPALLEVLHRYRPVLTERSYLLLRRAAAPADRSAAGETVVERTAQIGEEVRLDALPGPYQAVSLRFKHTECGKAQLLLYKPQELVMEVRLQGEERRRLYRLIPGMVGEEFLLNPLLEGGGDVLALYRGGGGKRVASLRVLPPAGGWASYRPEYRLTVRCLEDLPCRGGDVPPAELHAADPGPHPALSGFTPGGAP